MMNEEDFHNCHFCGEYVKKGYTPTGRRHFLSDCRPDLVKHEISDDCTWSFRRKPEFKRMKDETEDFPQNRTCYAYQDNSIPGHGVWTDEHIHFYEDRPM